MVILNKLVVVVVVESGNVIPWYGKNQHSVIFLVWDFEEICNQVVISCCFLLPVLSGQINVATVESCHNFI